MAITFENMKNIILFSIIALFAITAKATGTDSSTADSSKTTMKAPTGYYGDSAAIVTAGNYFKKAINHAALSVACAAAGSILVVTAPLTITTTYNTVRTSSTTVRTDKIVDDRLAVFMYSVGGLCGIASVAYSVSSLHCINKTAKALQFRANPTGIGVTYSF